MSQFRNTRAFFTTSPSVDATMGTSVVLKASGGNRAKNLEGIADSVDAMLDDPANMMADSAHIHLRPEQARKIKGWTEQLRIIADELAGKRK